MKTIFALSTFIAFCALNLAALAEADAFDSVLENSSPRPTVIVQDAPTSVIELPAPGAQLLPPPQIELQPSIQMPFDSANGLLIDDHSVLRPVIEQPFAPALCPGCNRQTCLCRPSAPTRTVFCLVDPSGCQHQACVNVPACCAGLQPMVSWKGRLFGRQVATLCWDCCDHEVKVVVTRRGEVKVRG